MVTKGQLIDVKGNLSSQIDVIVLKPSYPAALHHKRKYLLAGVAAAFECKLTLTKAGIFSAIESAAGAKRLSNRSEGTPYRELLGTQKNPFLEVTSLRRTHAMLGSTPDSARVVVIGRPQALRTGCSSWRI